MTKKKLTLKEKIAYGIGDLGNGFTFDLGQAYLLNFYTDVCGIGAATAGGVFLFSKIFDAFMDVLAGSFVDKHKASKNGKYRPVMMTSAIFLAFLTVITFIAPDVSVQGKLIYAYASYMIWGLCYSMVNIPYGSLSAAMTQDVHDRTQLASFRQGGSLLALLITGVVFMPIVLLFSDTRWGFPVAAAAVAIIGVMSHAYCYRNTREKVEATNSEPIKSSDLKHALTKNRPLWILIIMSIFTISAYNIKIAMLIYFCEYNLGDVKLMALINFIIIGSSVVSITSIPKLVKIFGKKKTMLLGFGISIIADIINFLIPSSPISFTVLATIAFVAISIPNGIVWALISDIIDFGEWKTGKRAAGVTYAAFSFSRKLAQSISGFSAGLGLSLIGYIPNAIQTQYVLFGIKGLLLLYPAITILIAALIIALWYELTDERCNQIVADLQQRKLNYSTT
jgi:GPH family glycoside/pentoside/hexuronide:cation symporter